MKRPLVLFFLVVILPFTLSAQEEDIDFAYTYDVPVNRFGDCLMTFLHAKWIADRQGKLLLYKPFAYSDKLSLSKAYFHYGKVRKLYSKEEQLTQFDVTYHRPNCNTILSVPYFPESSYEKENGRTEQNESWKYFNVDWNDKVFRKTVLDDLTPLVPLKKVIPPEHMISVALHMRKGGNFDSQVDKEGFVMKFLPDSYYIEQLKALHNILGKPLLYVYIFTDDHNPGMIHRKFKSHFSGENIVFHCRRDKNTEKINVLDDFFSLFEFDCLIHSHSNFSLIPSLLHDYLVQITPTDVVIEGGKRTYIQESLKVNTNHPKYDLLEYKEGNI